MASIFKEILLNLDGLLSENIVTKNPVTGGVFKSLATKIEPELTPEERNFLIKFNTMVVNRYYSNAVDIKNGNFESSGELQLVINILDDFALKLDDYLNSNCKKNILTGFDVKALTLLQNIPKILSSIN